MEMKGINGVSPLAIDPVNSIVSSDKTTAKDNADVVVNDDNASSDKFTGNLSEQADKEVHSQSLSELRKKAGITNVECKFGVDDETNRITVKILDKDTKEVIREVPSDQTLEMIAKVWEMAGILVDEKL